MLLRRAGVALVVQELPEAIQREEAVTVAAAAGPCLRQDRSDVQCSSTSFVRHRLGSGASLFYRGHASLPTAPNQVDEVSFLVDQVALAAACRRARPH